MRMQTTSHAVRPIPRINLMHLPAIKSQKPIHVSRSAFLTQRPQPSSLSQRRMFDADTGTFTNTDTIGTGTSTSEFPNSSSPATPSPATSKHVRTASDDDIQSEVSSGKRARLDNVTSNSLDGPAPPKETKIPQFAVGYISGGKPKTADYEDVVQALLRAMHEYESRIVGVSPYPDSANQSKWANICWKEACRVAVEDYSMTEQMSKMVCVLFPT
jgi:hypothetical protein